MDIDSAEKKLTSLDKFLTTLKVILKKHWGIITIILIGLFFYWVSTLPPVVEPLPLQEDIGPVEEDVYYPPMVNPVVEEEYYYEEEQPQEYYQEPAPEEPVYEFPVDVVYPE
jgi:hypothetical protein